MIDYIPSAPARRLLAALDGSPKGAGALSKETRVGRTHVYVYAEELQGHGLVFKLEPQGWGQPTTWALTDAGLAMLRGLESLEEYLNERNP